MFKNWAAVRVGVWMGCRACDTVEENDLRSIAPNLDGFVWFGLVWFVFLVLTLLFDQAFSCTVRPRTHNFGVAL